MFGRPQEIPGFVDLGSANAAEGVTSLIDRYGFRQTDELSRLLILKFSDGPTETVNNTGRALERIDDDELNGHLGDLAGPIDEFTRDLVSQGAATAYSFFRESVPPGRATLADGYVDTWHTDLDNMTPGSHRSIIWSDVLGAQGVKGILPPNLAKALGQARRTDRRNLDTRIYIPRRPRLFPGVIDRALDEGFLEEVVAEPSQIVGVDHERPHRAQTNTSSDSILRTGLVVQTALVSTA